MKSLESRGKYRKTEDKIKNKGVPEATAKIFGEDYI